MFKVRKHPFGYFGSKPTSERPCSLFVCSEIKNALRQITLSEDEILVSPRYHFCYRIAPVSLPCLPHIFPIIRRNFPVIRVILRFNSFPYNGGIPVRVNQLQASIILMSLPLNPFALTARR